MSAQPEPEELVPFSVIAKEIGTTPQGAFHIYTRAIGKLERLRYARELWQAVQEVNSEEKGWSP